MTEAPPEDRLRSDLLIDIGLLLVVSMLMSAFLAVLAGWHPQLWVGSFFLVTLTHAGFSIFDGSIRGWRVLTWTLVICVAIGQVVASVSGFIVPWGQIGFWLANIVANTPLIGTSLAQDFAFLIRSPWTVRILQLLLLLILAADVITMLWQRRHVSFLRLPTALLVGVALALGTLWLLPQRDLGSTGPGDTFTIVPPWFVLPNYSILRALPDKVAGLALAFLALVTPILAVWIDGRSLRHALPWGWLALCVGLAMTWLSLGYLGSLPPDDRSIFFTRILTLAYFTFFAVAVILGRNLPSIPQTEPSK